jgi:hypothetical protein
LCLAILTSTRPRTSHERNDVCYFRCLTQPRQRANIFDGFRNSGPAISIPFLKESVSVALMLIEFTVMPFSGPKITARFRAIESVAAFDAPCIMNGSAVIRCKLDVRGGNGEDREAGQSVYIATDGKGWLTVGHFATPRRIHYHPPAPRHDLDCLKRQMQRCPHLRRHRVVEFLGD